MFRFSCGADLVSLKNILTHILQGHGYEVYEKSDVLYAEKEESLVTVGIFDKLTALDVKKHAERMKDTDGMHVVCALGEVSQVVSQSAALEGLVLWKKEDIEAELGKAVVTHLANAEDGLFHQVLGAEPASEAEKIQERPAVSGACASPSEKQEVVVEILGTGQATKVLKPILTLEDAKELSDKTVHGFEHRLELLPHYLFRYSCAFKGRGGAEKKADGIVSVNALTGKHSIWDHELEFTNEIDTSHVQLEPKLDESAAEKIALGGVIELNTEQEELVTEKDHATVMEKTVFKPNEKDIQLENLGLVMVPIWCIEGSHGVMLIDAAARKVISEDYYQEKRV